MNGLHEVTKPARKFVDVEQFIVRQAVLSAVILDGIPALLSVARLQDGLKTRPDFLCYINIRFLWV